MSSIEVLSRTQKILVDSTRGVHVVNAGPRGPMGLQGDSTKDLKLVVTASASPRTILTGTGIGVHVHTLTENMTFIFSNPGDDDHVYSFTLMLKQDATGNREVTWPESVKWSNETTPSLSIIPHAIDILSFMTEDDGTTWYGFVRSIGAA